MAGRPSDPLLQLIRDLSRERGMNTATLAKAAGVKRSRIKHVLGGSESMTVDELILLSNLLELTPADLAGLPNAGDSIGTDSGNLLADADESEDAPPEPMIREATDRAEAQVVDPFGNHAEQGLRLAFGLGCDVMIVLETSQIREIGIPTATLTQFPENLPIRLDALYHRHNDPRFLPEGLQVTLSFDALYTCIVPWSAFKQVTFFPLAPDPVEPEPEPESPPTGRGRGFLRLVE